MTVQILLNLMTLIGAVSSIWFLFDKVQRRRRLSWKRLERIVSDIVEQMRQDDFSPTLICGVGRGGAILGALFSGALGHRPLVAIDITYEWKNGRRHESVFGSVPPEANLDRVLLVEGAVHSGNTIRLCYNHFTALGARTIKRATVYYQYASTEPVEYKGLVSTRSDLKMPWMVSATYLQRSRREDALPPRL